MYLVKYSYRWPDKTVDSGFMALTVTRIINADTIDYCKTKIEEYHKRKNQTVKEYYEFIEAL